MAIEAKLQETSGSAFEKLSYALDDCMAAPIPSIIVFSGRYIRDDMKAKLISSGHGIEAVQKGKRPCAAKRGTRP